MRKKGFNFNWFKKQTPQHEAKPAFVERRKTLRKSVDNIVNALSTMQTDLDNLRQEKIHQAQRLEEHKQLIEFKINSAINEKDRAEKIFGNIKGILAI